MTGQYPKVHLTGNILICTLRGNHRTNAVWAQDKTDFCLQDLSFEEMISRREGLRLGALCLHLAYSGSYGDYAKWIHRAKNRFFCHLGIKTYFLYFSTNFQQNQYIYQNFKFFYTYFFIFLDFFRFFTFFYAIFCGKIRFFTYFCRIFAYILAWGESFL